MTNPPQHVSSRYVRNLLASGKNSYFEIEQVSQMIAKTPNNIPIGVYYEVAVKLSSDFTIKRNDGATPEQACLRALEAFGVSFK